MTSKIEVTGNGFVSVCENIGWLEGRYKETLT